MNELKLYYRIVVKDKNGKVTRQTRWRRSKSWTIAFLKHLQYMMLHQYNVTVTAVSIADVGNVARTTGNGLHYFTRALACYAPDNDGAYGIVVGTGVTPVTNLDYNLAAIIAHGTGSGQLDYGSSSFTAAAVVGANVDMVLSRSLYNGSGATITIKEIGIIATSEDDIVTIRYFLICRDLIDSVDVLDTETASAQYTFRTTA